MPPAAAPARTLLAEVVGTAVPDVEAKWSVPANCPITTSWVFISWDVPAAPARPSAARSHVLAALLVSIRMPAAAALAALKAQPFLTHEGDSGKASEILHQLDLVDAFATVYQNWEAWIAAIPALWSKMADPASVRLPADFFVEREGYAVRMVYSRNSYTQLTGGGEAVRSDRVPGPARSGAPIKSPGA